MGSGGGQAFLLCHPCEWGGAVFHFAFFPTKDLKSTTRPYRSYGVIQGAAGKLARRRPLPFFGKSRRLFPYTIPPGPVPILHPHTISHTEPPGRYPAFSLLFSPRKRRPEFLRAAGRRFEISTACRPVFSTMRPTRPASLLSMGHSGSTPIPRPCGPGFAVPSRFSYPVPLKGLPGWVWAAGRPFCHSVIHQRS